MSEYEKNEQDGKTAEVMAAGGIDEETIALCLGIDIETLRAHYGDELTTSAAKANAKIIQKLYAEATGGNIAAIKWWTQARMGWSENNEKAPKRKWLTAEERKKGKADGR